MKINVDGLEIETEPGCEQEEEYKCTGVGLIIVDEPIPSNDKAKEIGIKFLQRNKELFKGLADK